ncbi:MAG: hypothetical protein O7F17_04995 [Planctomycetota bacterium]|nr:hypothetical protein [Planctomycetota bacterium]
MTQLSPLSLVVLAIPLGLASIAGYDREAPNTGSSDELGRHISMAAVASPTGADRVTLAFDAVRLDALVPFIMQESGKEVTVDPDATGYMLTLISSDVMSRDEAFTRIMNKLRSDGLDVRETEDTIVISAGQYRQIWKPAHVKISAGQYRQIWKPAHVKISASDAREFGKFGIFVSVSGDRAVVSSAHGVYVFRLDGATWTQEAKLTINDQEQPETITPRVSIDGRYCLLGARQSNHAGPNSGCVYVFRREGTEWLEHATLIPSDAAAGARFGTSVAISGDRCVIGAWGDDTVALDGGAAYVFRRDGMAWVEEAKLTVREAKVEDGFGKSVSISGEYCVISGARTQADFDHNRPGSAYVFHRVASRWVQQARLTPNDVDGWGLFGFYPVAISRDRLVVGGHRADGAGAAYVFRRDGDEWVQEARLSGHIADRTGFGASISIGEGYAVVGAHGAAYLFHLDGAKWKQAALLTVEDVTFRDSFGHAVAIDASHCIVAASRAKIRGEKAGAVFIWPSSWQVIPDTIRQQEIDAMTPDEAKNALASVAQSLRRQAPNEDLQRRLHHEFGLLMQRLKELRKEEADPTES